jgi:streptogramin lyase
MSAPVITPNQTFYLIQGIPFTDNIDYTGTVNSWQATGLPDGITINPTNGYISGTPTGYKDTNSLIIATNSDGSFSGIIRFIVHQNSSYDNDFTVLPSNGFAKVTGFKFLSNIYYTQGAENIYWDFGDGNISYEQSPTHIYENPGSYVVSLNAIINNQPYLSQKNISVSLLINESIYFDFVPPPTYAGHLNRYPFTIKFTSTEEGPHYIDLAVQYSRSYQYQEPRNKWSFLRPECKFLDLNGNLIEYIIPNETKLYADSNGKITDNQNGLFVGVSGIASFYVIDDIYNFDIAVNKLPYSTVIASLRTSGIKSYIDDVNINNDLPSYSNTLAIATCPHIFLWASPDNIKITENGIRNYINPRWSQAIQPIIINTNFNKPYLNYWCDDGNNVIFAPLNYNFCHNIPNVQASPVKVDVGLVSVSSNFVPTPQFKWIDDTGYLTPGYYKGYFDIPDNSSLSTYLTAKMTYKVPNLSAQYMYNPILWVSNPEAGMMANFQYTYDPNSIVSTLKNLNIAHVNPFDMPIITQPDFTNDPMALSGFHGIYSIAAVPYPDYHAWALDSEMNYLYRVSTAGQILCSIDINKVVTDNQLGFLVPNHVSPANIVLDSKQNIWMTLYDTVSTLKFDSYGNFLSAFNPLNAITYNFPPIPKISPAWYRENSYLDKNTVNNISLYNFSLSKINFATPNTSRGIAVYSDGSQIFVAGRSLETNLDKGIRCYDGSGNFIYNSILDAAPFDLKMDNNNRFMYISIGQGSAGGIKKFDTITKANSSFNITPAIDALALNKANSKLYGYSSSDTTPRVYICNLNAYPTTNVFIGKDSTVTNPFDISYTLNAICLSNDDSVLYVGATSQDPSNPDKIYAINASNYTLLNVINLPAGSNPSALAVSTDNSILYVAEASRNVVDVIDLSINSIANSIPINSPSNLIIVNQNNVDELYVTSLGNPGFLTLIIVYPNYTYYTLNIGLNQNPYFLTSDSQGKVYTTNINTLLGNITTIQRNYYSTPYLYDKVDKVYYLPNNIDLNFLEPTGIDTDTKDNVWTTYSNFMSGYLVKQDSVGNILYTYSYPVCSCPQQIVVDNSDNVWIALSDNIYSTQGSSLEKRSSNGTLLSSFKVNAVNYLTLDTRQNIWFTFSYDWLGSIDNNTGSIFTVNLSGTDISKYAPDWFDPNKNTDETAFEGIGCDLLGRLYLINSIENQIYVFDSFTKTLLNKFIINPQGFTFYLDDQYQPTKIDANLWNKSLQASGDWTANRWINKYGANTLPLYNTSNSSITITGSSTRLDFFPYENYDIYKFNEGFDLAGQMQSLAFMPSLNESTFLFNIFLGSIYGKYPYKHDDLATRSYEKISNFNQNINDVDYCGYKNINDLVEMMDADPANYTLNLPTDIERILDFATINKSRLFGARSLSQNAFNSPNSKNILNRGNLLTLNYNVTAGIPVVLKDRSLNKYRFVPTGYVNSLSSYSLTSLATSIGLTDSNWTSYYEFYEFIPSFDYTQTDGIIDWSNPQTTIKENLSSVNYWFGENGILEKQLSYNLYKGFGLV